MPHEAYDVREGVGLPPKCPFSCLDSCEYLFSPWPLSEDFFLVGTNVEHPTTAKPKLLLIDKLGNQELVYSPDVEAHAVGYEPRDNPGVWFTMPLRAKQATNPLATMTYQGERAGLPEHKRATLALLNMYESDFQWPANTKIKELRVIQVIPRGWGGGDMLRPNIGYGRGATGRMVMGTVPVEEDGSAYFEAPVGKLLYFQALDERGLAIMSMRSGTYVHPGEQLQCIGCHEDKWKAIPPRTSLPTAFSRPPSPLAAEPSGSCPLTFARLVQPLINGKCKPCHQQNNNNVDLSYGGSEPSEDFTPGKGLEPWAFYFDGYDRMYETQHGGSRAAVGRFGALESRLGKKMLETHLDRLTKEELRRVTLWLDCNSVEVTAIKGNFATPEQAFAAQRNGEVVWPEIDVDPANPTGVEKDRPSPDKATVVQRFIREGFLSNSPGLADQGSIRIIPMEKGFAIRNPSGDNLTVTVFDFAGRTVRTIRDNSPDIRIGADGLVAGGTYLVRVAGARRSSAKLLTMM
jgi:hypothetical protein